MALDLDNIEEEAHSDYNDFAPFNIDDNGGDSNEDDGNFEDCAFEDLC